MKNLEANIIRLYGENGKQWLRDLPNLVMQIKLAYGLSNLKPVADLSYHYVLSGFQDEQPIIVKVGLDIDQLKRETLAIKAFSGLGVPQVLSENNGMLIQIRAIPGTSLRSYFPSCDDQAISIAANIIKRLHKALIPSVHKFPHVRDWLSALDNDWKIPVHYMQRARQLRDSLLQSSTKDVLLHGDLHHDNILQHNNDWLVIDPKGVIGEPAYEVAAFIRNPMPALLADKNLSKIIRHRITRFADILGYSESRIKDWCFIQAVLAWAWALEDRGDEIYFRQLTKIMSVISKS